MNRKLILILLTGIIILAAVLRLWQLGNVPVSPDWDEAALGYNAYSIIQTGRDEFGKFLPVVLRSFDDYKPALYAYLSIPSILIFGLNTFAVRLPSAIFGIISVIAVFFLVRELFEKYKYRDQLSLLSGFLLAISPWSIQFSRVAFESNVGDSLNILMALFFIKGLKKPWMLFLSVIFAALSIYTYQSEKVFTPLLLLALILIFRKSLFLINKKIIVFSIILGLVVIFPMVSYIFNNSSSLQRATGTSIFSSQTELLKTNIQKLERDKLNNDRIGFLLDNRRIVYVQSIVSGYISHFDINWLFIKGDSVQRHHAPNMGLLYLFELPFILLGIYFLIFGEFSRKTKFLIFAWFLLVPIPASITTGVPHAVRTLNFLPTFQILTAIGFVTAIVWLSNLKLRILNVKILYIVGFLYFIFAVLNFGYYLNQYFVQQNYYNSKDWQYGYKQTVESVLKFENKYKKVVISNKSLDQSYIFFLFYLQYSPSDYQKNSEDKSFRKYVFKEIDWKVDSKIKNTLYVGASEEIPEGINIIKTIYNLDGTPAIRIAGT
jgi:4-amino-4-deoxy-L-arabinose transferase-like glycosyltransferase